MFNVYKAHLCGNKPPNYFPITLLPHLCQTPIYPSKWSISAMHTQKLPGLQCLVLLAKKATDTTGNVGGLSLCTFLSILTRAYLRNQLRVWHLPSTRVKPILNLLLTIVQCSVIRVKSTFHVNNTRQTHDLYIKGVTNYFANSVRLLH